MKKIILCLFTFLFTSSVVFAETIYQDGFSFDTPTRNGDLVLYSFKISNMANLDNEIMKYNKELQKLQNTEIAAIEGKIICNCKTNKMKTESIFFDSKGNIIARNEEKDFESRADDIVQEFCKMY